MTGRSGRVLVAAALVFSACNSSGEGTPLTDTVAPTTTVPTVVSTATTFDIPDRGQIDDLLTRCPSAVDAAFVRQQIDLVFDADPTAPELVCTEADGSIDLTRLEERAVQALLALEATVFEDPLPWTDLQVFDWLVETIDGIRYRDDIQASFCCEPEGYVNVPTGNLTTLDTNRWIDPSVGAGMIDLVGLIIHEARHNEGVVHTCEDGVRDETVVELGAWGVESILYRWYADQADQTFFVDPNRPDYYAAAARQRADAILQTQFCE